MNQIRISEAQKLANPGPVSMVCTENPNGSTNLAPVGWWTILSYNPGMIGFAMHRDSHSGEMVRRTGNVIITIPGAEAADTIMSCGTTSGRNTKKAEKFGITLVDVTDSPIQIPLHTRIAIVAKLEKVVETGDHYLYICNVINSYADENEKTL